MADMVPENQFHLQEGADRIIEAVRLYHEGSIDRILISGGAADINNPEYNEGLSLARLAMDLRVLEEDILLENQSRNTYENAKFSKNVIPENDQDFLLITSAFHMPRALRCFEKQGISVQPYPVDFQVDSSTTFSDFLPSDKALRKWNILIKELVGLVTYKLLGYI